MLADSLVTSSVESGGDGGDITVTGHSPAKVLVLDGGFVQANAPAGARGGDIFIDADDCCQFSLPMNSMPAIRPSAPWIGQYTVLSS